MLEVERIYGLTAYKENLKEMCSMYISNDDMANCKSLLEEELELSTLDRIDNARSIVELGHSDILDMHYNVRTKYLHSAQFKVDVPSGQLRGAFHNYHRSEMRLWRLESFLNKDNNSKKVGVRLRTIFEKVIDTISKSGNTRVPATQLIETIASSFPRYILTDYGKLDTFEISKEPFYSSIMSMIEVFKKIGALDIEVNIDKDSGARLHMVSMPSVDHIELEHAYSLHRIVNRRRVQLEPVPAVQEDDRVLTKGQWKYKSPKLSPSVIQYLNIVNGVKVVFRNDDDAFFNSLLAKWKVEANELAEWQISKGKTFETEYLESRANKGHYRSNSFDSVGRTYDSLEVGGVYSNSTMRAGLELPSVYTTLNGKEEIKLHIACLMGYDKNTKEEAMEGFALHNQEWLDAGECPLGFEALDRLSSGYVIWQDATNSGTQQYAIGLMSKTLAEISGLIKGKRKDAYSELAELLNGYLSVNCFSRKNVKGIFMTKLYAAGWKLLLRGRHNYETDMFGAESFTEKHGKLIPLLETLGYNVHDFREEKRGVIEDKVWSAFEKAMMVIAPDAMIAMAAITRLLDKDDRTLIEWEMPDGFKAQLAMHLNANIEVIWCDHLGHRHHFTHVVKVLEAGAKASALAARLIHSIDAYVLRDLVRRAALEGIDVLTVHDAFGSYAEYAGRIRELYREVMADCLDMRLMSNLINQINIHKKNLGGQAQAEPLTREDVLNSEYALWA